MTQRSNQFSDGIHPVLALLTLGAIVACGGDPETRGGDPDGLPNQTPGIHAADGEVLFRTEPVTLGPGTERFVCYTQTLKQDLVIGGFNHGGKSFVHHVIFAKTTGDEPEGSSDCDTLFRFSWEPIFMAGAGASEIEFPEGIAQVLPAGTRLLAQMHLLNNTQESVTDSIEIHMHPSSAQNPRPMGTYAFGNLNVSLPPLQPSSLEGVCTVPETLKVVAAIPHMHLLGKSLTFEVGPSADQLKKVFERNPYDFDSQRIELLDLTLNPGDVTRVTCNFENTTDQTITFGESTKSEMCFLAAFVADRTGVAGCTVGSPAP